MAPPDASLLSLGVTVALVGYWKCLDHHETSCAFKTNHYLLPSANTNGIRNDSVSVLAKVLRQRTNQEVPTTPMSRGEALDQLFEELSENL